MNKLWFYLFGKSEEGSNDSDQSNSIDTNNLVRQSEEELHENNEDNCLENVIVIERKDEVIVVFDKALNTVNEYDLNDVVCDFNPTVGDCIKLKSDSDGNVEAICPSTRKLNGTVTWINLEKKIGKIDGTVRFNMNIWNGKILPKRGIKVTYTLVKRTDDILKVLEVGPIARNKERTIDINVQQTWTNDNTGDLFSTRTKNDENNIKDIKEETERVHDKEVDESIPDRNEEKSVTHMRVTSDIESTPSEIKSKPSLYENGDKKPYSIEKVGHIRYIKKISNEKKEKPASVYDDIEEKREKKIVIKLKNNRTRVELNDNFLFTASVRSVGKEDSIIKIDTQNNFMTITQALYQLPMTLQKDTVYYINFRVDTSQVGNFQENITIHFKESGYCNFNAKYSVEVDHVPIKYKNKYGLRKSVY